MCVFESSIAQSARSLSRPGVRTIFADEVKAHETGKGHETRKGSHYYTRSPSEARV